jgi:endoglucanase
MRRGLHKPGARDIRQTFSSMVRPINTSPTMPEMIGPNGVILIKGVPVDFSAALVPFLLSFGNEAAAGARFQIVDKHFDLQTGHLGKQPRNYDQNLAFFTPGWQEQRFRFAPDGELRVRWQN